MKTMAEIRKERGIKIKHHKDSLYTPVIRKKRVFNKLQVPRDLQTKLPFKSKPKVKT